MLIPVIGVSILSIVILINKGGMALARTIGYMRISTVKDTQHFGRQEAQLTKCDYIYRDRISGSKRDRPQLNKMLEELQEGDTVVITSIDRLSRSTSDLLSIVETIKEKGASLKSLNDSWLDTTTDNPLSSFLLTIMGALAEMEREMIRQRVKEGVKIAQQRGTKFGRPTANKSKVSLALDLYNAGEHTVKEISAITGLSESTIYRKLKENTKSIV